MVLRDTLASDQVSVLTGVEETQHTTPSGEVMEETMGGMMKGDRQRWREIERCGLEFKSQCDAHPQAGWLWVCCPLRITYWTGPKCPITCHDS